VTAAPAKGRDDVVVTGGLFVNTLVVVRHQVCAYIDSLWRTSMRRGRESVAAETRIIGARRQGSTVAAQRDESACNSRAHLQWRRFSHEHGHAPDFQGGRYSP
jgi:hypothetical protein